MEVTVSHRNKALKVCAAIALMSLAAAACGGSDDATSSSSSSSNTVTGTAIKIGALVNETSPSSIDLGSSRKVAAAWEKAINADGGISGHPVKIVYENTEGDPAKGTAAAEKFINDSTISAVYILDASGDTVFGPTLSKASLPVIGGVGFNPAIWNTLPNVFHITTAQTALNASQVIAAKQNDKTVVAFAGCAELPACALSEKNFTANAGTLQMQSAGFVSVAAANPDYTAECRQFIDQKAGFVQLSLNGSTASRLALDCVTQGYDGVFGATSTVVRKGLWGADIKLVGALSSFPWYADAAPVKKFLDLVKGADISEADYTNNAATATYATLELFKKTVAAKADLLTDGNLTRSEVVGAYGTISGETLDGLLPQAVTFKANEPSPKLTCFWLYKAEGGKISGDFTPTCAEKFGL